MNDFNVNYVACFRTTHTFLAWRSQYILSSVLQQIADEKKAMEESTLASAVEPAEEIKSGKAMEMVEIGAKNSDDPQVDESDGSVKSTVSDYRKFILSCQ